MIVGPPLIAYTIIGLDRTVVCLMNNYAFVQSRYEIKRNGMSYESQ